MRCHLYRTRLYMLSAFKNINEHATKLFWALELFADTRHIWSYIRGKYAVYSTFWRFFHFSWFQITLRRSNVIVRGPTASEISTGHIWVLYINSRKKHVWSSTIIYSNFFSFWCPQNTIFGQKIRKICGCRNFLWSLKCFLEGPQIWNFFWNICSLGI